MTDVDKQRRRLVKTGGALAIGGLAGCLSSPGGGGGNGGGGSDKTNVGMVYALGGKGDDSFNEMAFNGVKKAKEEMSVAYDEVEPGGASEFQALQRKFASSKDPKYDLVCCIGFVQTDALKKTSKNFSKQNFMLVDGEVKRDNVSSYVFKEHEGSFQVGHLAGLLTTTDFSKGGGSTNGDKMVGFVGGKKNPLIKKFEAGFKAGAKHADDGISVKSAYAGSWSDVQRGKEIALSMYNEGADIVYHAAGGTGNGVFKAAKQESRYAIGVDSDQSQSASSYANWIVASMVKHVDTAVYKSVKRVANDNFDGGTTHALGLEKNGVEAVIGQKYTGEIPKQINSKLKKSKQAIIDGDISVPTDPKNV
ncbi:BMP family lipoprotein [Halomicrococcus sp. NG-SE-24]|uniref:BMP family lipoprotein n=1 Tax=Halomicrococcus sp. NG-SE-24 TaxID=3436928 RepID=UPI003D96330F